MRCRPFTLDAANPPTACAATTDTIRRINYFDPEFRFPQNFKLAAGADLFLPGGVVGTVDLLYTQGINTFHMVDVNLTAPTATAAGEGGRLMYGTIDPESGERHPPGTPPPSMPCSRSGTGTAIAAFSRRSSSRNTSPKAPS